MSNRQTWLNTAVAGIVAQGGPAHGRWPESGLGLDSCLYRAPDGHKCAVGQLIPDAMYDPRMDLGTMTFEDIIATFGADGRGDLRFLSDMQVYIHDDLAVCPGGDFMALFPDAVAAFAAEYGLTNPLA